MAKTQIGNGGIVTISGAISKPTKKNGHNHGNYVIVTHRTAATTNPNCQRFYVKDKDAYKRSTPISDKEQQIRTRFLTVRQAIEERKADLSKIAADQAAFENQKNLPGGKTTMLSWYWKICGDEYDQLHPRD